MLNKRDLSLDTTLRWRELEYCGWVDNLTWLSDDILLLSGWFHAEAEEVEACLIQNDLVLPLEVRCLSYSRPDVPGDDPLAGKLLTARFLRQEDFQEATFARLVIGIEGSTFSPNPVNLPKAVDLQTLINVSFSWLDPTNRMRILEFLSLTLKEHLGTTNILRLSRNLAIIREALRERYPTFPMAPQQPRNLCFDHLLAINETSFYIRGWVSDPDAKIRQLRLVSPEGSLIDITDKLFYFTRPDIQELFRIPSPTQGIAKNGVLGFFTTDSPSFLNTGWLAQMTNDAGDKVEATLPPVTRDYTTVKEIILTELGYRASDDKLLSDHVFPALSQLQWQRHEQIEIAHIEQYGHPSESSAVSIIIPLYKRIDFLEHQLAQFVHDPEIHQADLIYVLDSPEQADLLGAVATQLFRLYKVPFRIVTLTENFGYSAANNVGASIARGRLLLLLNSDVLPDKPGWLGEMVSFYDSMPGIGALGPKLLFEDDTLQHAGLYFERLDNSPLWTNQHYFKGYERDLPVANKARAVPSVTGACMMVATDLFKKLGGLRGTYVQGDFEDSDFCLRLIASGHKNWYLPHVELYHLEGQSYPAQLRQLTWKFNAWVHTRLWGDLIEEVMSKYPTGFQTTPTRPAEIPLMHFAAMPVSGGGSSFSRERAGRPALVRTSRSDLVDLYLQTCTKRNRLDDQTGSPVWIMSESGSIIGYSASESGIAAGRSAGGHWKKLDDSTLS